MELQFMELAALIAPESFLFDLYTRFVHTGHANFDFTQSITPCQTPTIRQKNPPGQFSYPSTPEHYLENHGQRTKFIKVCLLIPSQIQIFHRKYFFQSSIMTSKMH